MAKAHAVLLTLNSQCQRLKFDCYKQRNVLTSLDQFAEKLQRRKAKDDKLSQLNSKLHRQLVAK